MFFYRCTCAYGELSSNVTVNLRYGTYKHDKITALHPLVSTTWQERQVGLTTGYKWGIGSRRSLRTLGKAGQKTRSLHTNSAKIRAPRAWSG